MFHFKLLGPILASGPKELENSQERSQYHLLTPRVYPQNFAGNALMMLFFTFKFNILSEMKLQDLQI